MSFLNTWRPRPDAIPPQDPRPAPGGDSEPEPILVVDEDEAWAHECAAMLRALGYRPYLARTVEAAVDRFLAQPIALALVDCDMPGRDGSGPGCELARAAQAHGRAVRMIMTASRVSVERVIAAIRAAALDFLEKPIQPVDLRRALQRARGLDDSPPVRRALIDTMADLRAELERLGRLIDDTGSAGRMASEASGAPLAGAALADYIRGALRNEARRRSIGSGDVFGDPAWEMLLDLMLAKIEGRRVSVSSACIASGAPMSTALRLVGRLVEEGVLHKIPDHSDRRRHFLMLSPRFEQPLLEHLHEQARKCAGFPR